MMPLSFNVQDLAPGDQRCAKFDTSLVSLSRIRSGSDPLFEPAYNAFVQEFQPARQIERPEVLKKRFEWNFKTPPDGIPMQYEIIVAQASGKVVAARDHVVMIRDNTAVVRLGHVAAQREWLQTGLVGWLRAFPLQTARECLVAAGAASDGPIILVAEVEMNTPEGLARVRACEQAGYLKVDPRVVPYVAPDFREPAEIDATGGPRPVPYSLVLRRVGKEKETMISGCEIRMIVKSLYAMYARECRPQEMESCWRLLPSYPSAWSDVELLQPTS